MYPTEMANKAWNGYFRNAADLTPTELEWVLNSWLSQFRKWLLIDEIRWIPDGEGGHLFIEKRGGGGGLNDAPHTRAMVHAGTPSEIKSVRKALRESGVAFKAAKLERKNGSVLFVALFHTTVIGPEFVVPPSELEREFQSWLDYYMTTGAVGSLTLVPHASRYIVDVGIAPQPPELKRRHLVKIVRGETSEEVAELLLEEKRQFPTSIVSNPGRQPILRGARHPEAEWYGLRTYRVPLIETQSDY